MADLFPFCFVRKYRDTNLCFVRFNDGEDGLWRTLAAAGWRLLGAGRPAECPVDGRTGLLLGGLRGHPGSAGRTINQVSNCFPNYTLITVSATSSEDSARRRSRSRPETTSAFKAGPRPLTVTIKLSSSQAESNSFQRSGLRQCSRPPLPGLHIRRSRRSRLVTK